MQILLRMGAAFVSIMLTMLAISMMMAILRGDSTVLSAFIFLVVAIATIATWWLAVGGHNLGTSARAQTAMKWALIVGAISFLGGFAGPIFLKPESNQGPLLGIFITGPLGFVIGFIVGYFR